MEKGVFRGFDPFDWFDKLTTGKLRAGPFDKLGAGKSAWGRLAALTTSGKQPTA
jgi:hypothetical protein